MTNSDTKRSDRWVAIGAAAGKVFSVTAAVLALGRFVFKAHALLLKYPPVWPDEALWADCAINLIRQRVLASDLLAGVVPGMGQHLYWMPPGYFLFLAGVFRVWKPGIVAMRVASLITALVVMILTYSVGRRAGLGRWIALSVVALVAVDSAFLRGALIGRMDMLSLAFILAALLLVMESVSSSPKRLFITGIVSAAAMLTHPMGVVAPITVVGTQIFPSRECRRRIGRMRYILAGIVVVTLPWAIYVLRNVSDFKVQVGGQFGRNATYRSRSDQVRAILLSYLPQYESLDLHVSAPKSPDAKEFPEPVHGSPWSLLLGPLVWATGLAGLGLAAKEHPDRVGLLVCQVMILCLVIWGNEHWYVLYLVPLSAVGLSHFVTLNTRSGFGRGALAAVGLLICAWFAQSNVKRVSVIEYTLNSLYSSTTNYNPWSTQISRAIPPGSRVLIAVMPDPYFGLMNRRDLVLREFFPVRLPIDETQYRRYIAGVDYMIVGPSTTKATDLGIIGSQSPDPRLDRFLEDSGQLVTGVGSEPGYFARIYKVTK